MNECTEGRKTKPRGRQDGIFMSEDDIPKTMLVNETLMYIDQHRHRASKDSIIKVTSDSILKRSLIKQRTS